MVYVVLFLFVLVTALPWIVHTSSNLLHPINVFVAVQLVLIVPGVIVLLIDPGMLDYRVSRIVWPDLQSAVSWTLSMMIVLNLCTYAALYFWHPKVRIAARTAPALEQRPFDNYGYVALLMVAMIIAFMLKVRTGGGFGLLFANTDQRAELHRGLGVFDAFEVAARWLAIIILIRIALLRNNLFSWLTFLGVLVFTATLGAIFGSRKAALDLVMLAFMTIGFYRPEVFKLSLRAVAIGASMYALVLLYLFAGLIYRNSTTGVSLGSVLLSSTGDLGYLLYSASLFDSYFFTTNFYNSTNYYYGSLIGDLKTVLLPSTWYPEKAIVDDGIYVKYAINGIVLPPQTPVIDVVADSVPPESLGAAYMNGGPFLVPVYGLVLGSFLAFVLRNAERHPNEPLWLVTLSFAFVTFELSTLRITGLTALLIFCVIYRIALRPFELDGPRLTQGRARLSDGSSIARQ